MFLDSVPQESEIKEVDMVAGVDILIKYFLSLMNSARWDLNRQNEIKK